MGTFLASFTWETEMTIDSPWREVAFGVDFRFSRSSWWQAITWYRRTWGIRPFLSQSLICNRRSEVSRQSQEPFAPHSLFLSSTPCVPLPFLPSFLLARTSLSSPRTLRRWSQSWLVVGVTGERLFRQGGESSPTSFPVSTVESWKGRKLEVPLIQHFIIHVARTPGPVRCHLKKKFSCEKCW